MQISDLEIDTARFHREASVFLRTLIRLRDDLRNIDADNYLGEEEFWEELEKFIELSREKLEDADRRAK